MGDVSTIGVDIAKSVFQIHGVDVSGTVVIRKRIGRAKVLEFFTDLPRCLVGMEACATAHQWARELKKLGHDTRLMPPTYVKAYAKRGKNDANDAAAICEAVTRPSMRFVPIKSVEQQSALMLHRTRDLLIRQRTQLIKHFVPIWPSSGWWQRRDMKDCISRLRPWQRAAMSSCQVTHALPVRRSLPSSMRCRPRSTGSTSASFKPIAPMQTANDSKLFQGSA
jgi:hypothetical protein